MIYSHQINILWCNEHKFDATFQDKFPRKPPPPLVPLPMRWLFLSCASRNTSKISRESGIHCRPWGSNALHCIIILFSLRCIFFDDAKSCSTLSTASFEFKPKLCQVIFWIKFGGQIWSLGVPGGFFFLQESTIFFGAKFFFSKFSVPFSSQSTMFSNNDPAAPKNCLPQNLFPTNFLGCEIPLVVESMVFGVGTCSAYLTISTKQTAPTFSFTLIFFPVNSMSFKHSMVSL